jgi:hypothetical protein
VTKTTNQFNNTDTAGQFALTLGTHASATNGPTEYFLKGRGTLASPSVVASGDTLGILIFSGFDGTDYRQGVNIVSSVDGTPGTGDMPGRLTFWTSVDGTASPVEAMRIDALQNMGIGGTANATNILDLISTTKSLGVMTMTTTQKNAISSPRSGSLVYDSTLGKLCVRGAAAWETMTSV